jgi:hypothetical protein
MLNLQQKAHYSLDEYRKGRGSPMNRSEPPTPDTDELSVLGGRTRLVAKQEPSSPIIDRSPTTHNPIVPLPLSPSMEGQMHPSIWEYLDTFSPHQNQTQDSSRRHSSSSSAGIPSGHNSFSEDVSMYGMSSLPTPSAFQSEPASFIVNHQAPSAAHQSSHRRQTSHSSISSIQTNPAGPSTNGGLSFPQYFPVYDYGNAMNNGGINGNYANGNGFVPGPTLEPPLSHVQRRATGSPEGNMHSTWQDFVTEMAI